MSKVVSVIDKVITKIGQTIPDNADEWHEFRGGRYIGELLNDLPHGHGVWVQDAGYAYVGEWQNGREHGFAQHTCPDGSVHVGEWKEGRKQGVGIEGFADGSSYLGEWQDGKKFEGTWKSPSGREYLYSGNYESLEQAENEFQETSKRLIEQLNLDAELGEALVEEGFLTPEEVAYVPIEELLILEGFDQELVEQLRRRAKEFLDIREFSELEKTRPEDDLLSMEGMDDETARLFAQNGVRSMEDLAECATDELVELSGIDAARAAELIMTARAPWFAEVQSEEELK